MSIKCLASFVLCMAGGIAAHAQAQPDDFSYPDRSDTLDQIVVTGTRTPKPLKNSPILTRVISGTDIRKVDATNVTDLLQSELPGIEFSYSMNQQVSLNMQGFGGTSVLFLVDGERLAGETLDNVDYSRLNLSNVGRVEIVKGAASSLYGSSAVGGVVNIITRESTEPWKLNVNARYGSHNEQRYGATASFNKGRFNNSFTAQYNSVNSYNFPNPGAYTSFYGGYNYDFKDRLTVRVADRIRLIARAGYYFRERNSAETSRDRYRDFSTGLRGIYDITDIDNLEVSYNLDQYDKSVNMLLYNAEVRKYSNVQNNVRAVYSHTFASKHILTAGSDFMHDYLMSYQFENNGYKTQMSADVFAQFDMNFFKNLNMIAGARYDWFSASGLHYPSFKFSMMYRPVDPLALRCSYAGGFRAPTLKEMYMNFDMASIFTIYGNEDLQPEKSHNFQLSAEFARKGFNVNAGAFYNLVGDRITTAWSQTLKGMLYTNVDRVDVAGVDANVSWNSKWGLGAKLSYVYTYEHVAKGQPYTSSTRPHTATARIDYGHDWKNYGFNVSLNGRWLSAVGVDEYTSNTSYEETERVNYPGYTIWKLNFVQHVWRGIDITLAIDNLFNYIPEYYYSNSPTTTGIGFSAGISLDIEKFFEKAF